MGIVHAAIYDAALAIEGGYEPYAIALDAPRHTSAAAAVATAAHHTLIGLQPSLGLTAAQQAVLDGRYADYLAAIPDTRAKSNGIAVGEHVALAVLALRADDGRERNPQLADLDPPPPGPGIWSSGGGVALGLRLPGMKPLALESAIAVPPRRTDAAGQRGLRDRLRRGRGVRPRRQRREAAGSDCAGAVLDRPRSAAVERRDARPGRGRPARPRRDRQDAGARSRRRRRRDDRLLRRQVQLLVLAAVPGDPAGGRGRQRRDGRRRDMAAAATDAGAPRVPVRARLSHDRGRRGAAGVLRHRAGSRSRSTAARPARRIVSTASARRSAT